MHWWQDVLLIVAGPCIAWVTVCAIRDAIHARLAARDLPIVARELGLKVKPTTRLPELHGKIDGFEVAVSSDMIEITLRSHPPWFGHMSFPLPPPYSWILRAGVLAFASDGEPNEFDFGDRVLDRFFSIRRVHTRGASAEVPAALRSALRRFVDRHGRFSMLVVGSAIQCAPMVGHSGPPKTHAISGSQVRALMPELLALAKALEAACPPDEDDDDDEDPTDDEDDDEADEASAVGSS